MTDTDMWQPLLQSMDQTMALYRNMLEMSEQKKHAGSGKNLDAGGWCGQNGSAGVVSQIDLII